MSKRAMNLQLTLATITTLIALSMIQGNAVAAEANAPPSGSVFGLWAQSDGKPIVDRPEDATAPLPPPCREGIDKSVPGGCIKADWPQCIVRFQLGNFQDIEANYYGYYGSDIVYLDSVPKVQNDTGAFMCSEQEVQDNGYIVTTNISGQTGDTPVRVASIGGQILVAAASIPCFLKIGGMWFVRSGCTRK